MAKGRGPYDDAFQQDLDRIASGCSEDLFEYEFIMLDGIVAALGDFMQLDTGEGGGGGPP